MRDDQRAVAGQVHVELRVVHAVPHGDPKRLERIFGSQGAGAAVAHRDGCGHAAVQMTDSE